MADPDVAAPSVIPTPGTCQKAWTTVKTLVNHLLNADDPAVSADILGYCVLLPLSLYWMHTRPKIDTQWAACFATIWAAVGLKAFARRSRGGQ